MIRIDTLWLCSQPQDMRAGADRLLNIVVNTVGAARAHHGYLFANARATRIKLLVHDGFGVWCATRRLHAGRFVWVESGAADCVFRTNVTARFGIVTGHFGSVTGRCGDVTAGVFAPA